VARSSFEYFPAFELNSAGSTGLTTLRVVMIKSTLM